LVVLPEVPVLSDLLGPGVALTLPVLVLPVEPALPAVSDLPDALAPLLGVTPVLPVLAGAVPLDPVELQAARTNAHAKGMIHLVI
jgi:hypothetical protein